MRALSSAIQTVPSLMALQASQQIAESAPLHPRLSRIRVITYQCFNLDCRFLSLQGSLCRGRAFAILSSACLACTLMSFCLDLLLCVSVDWAAGGDALASDLIWRELRVLAEKKPVIASMGDVAASGAL